MPTASNTLHRRLGSPVNRWQMVRHVGIHFSATPPTPLPRTLHPSSADIGTINSTNGVPQNRGREDEPGKHWFAPLFRSVERAYERCFPLLCTLPASQVWEALIYDNQKQREPPFSMNWKVGHTLEQSSIYFHFNNYSAARGACFTQGPLS